MTAGVVGAFAEQAAWTVRPAGEPDLVAPSRRREAHDGRAGCATRARGARRDELLPAGGGRRARGALDAGTTGARARAGTASDHRARRLDRTLARERRRAGRDPDPACRGRARRPDGAGSYLANSLSCNECPNPTSSAAFSRALPERSAEIGTPLPPLLIRSR